MSRSTARTLPAEVIEGSVRPLSALDKSKAIKREDVSTLIGVCNRKTVSFYHRFCLMHVPGYKDFALVKRGKMMLIDPQAPIVASQIPVLAEVAKQFKERRKADRVLAFVEQNPHRFNLEK